MCASKRWLLSYDWLWCIWIWCKNYLGCDIWATGYFTNHLAFVRLVAANSILNLVFTWGRLLSHFFTIKTSHRVVRKENTEYGVFEVYCDRTVYFICISRIYEDFSTKADNVSKLFGCKAGFEGRDVWS